ncbi:MAG: TlpA family protein disulfide reductase [Candidatus Marinimicrobia bacterium]|nr:TlpA family protein disulfide reductase [Candidatus Neomarinimicrobiota bacterium]
MKRIFIIIGLCCALFSQDRFSNDSLSLDFPVNDSIQMILDSLVQAADSTQRPDSGRVEKTDQTLRKVENFYASGLNNQGFFLSRNIPPKVRPEQKTNMLFSFFTTGCIPCRKEIPFLEKQTGKFDIKKAYLVNIGEDKERVEKYLEHFQTNLNILLDPYSVVSKKLNVTTTPVLIIISGDGDLLYRHNGFQDSDTTEILEKFNQYFGKINEPF